MIIEKVRYWVSFSYYLGVKAGAEHVPVLLLLLALLLLYVLDYVTSYKSCVEYIRLTALHVYTLYALRILHLCTSALLTARTSGRVG